MSTRYKFYNSMTVGIGGWLDMGPFRFRPMAIEKSYLIPASRQQLDANYQTWCIQKVSAQILQNQCWNMSFLVPVLALILHKTLF